MSAGERRGPSLWEGPTSYPSPVLGVVYADLELRVDDFEAALAESTARVDDARWLHFALGPWRGWQAFLNWWIARRWVMPRDVRKQ